LSSTNVDEHAHGDETCLLQQSTHLATGSRVSALSLLEDEVDLHNASDVVEFTDSYTSNHTVGNRVIKIKGFKPSGGGKFPVYVYLPGTFDEHFTPQDMSWVKYMAQKGFYAVTIGYENHFGFCLDICRTEGGCSMGLLGPDDTTLLPKKAKSIIDGFNHICSSGAADCDKGLALMGHSQGSYISSLCGILDPRVTAMLLMGIGPMADRDWQGKTQFMVDMRCILDAEMDKHVPRSKRLYINGEMDDLSHADLSHDNRGLEAYSGHVWRLNKHSGYACAAKKPPVSCVQKDGSGYYIVGENQYTVETRKKGIEVAGHNFFSTPVNHFGGVEQNSEFFPAYKDGTEPWCMKPSLNWLAGAAQYHKTPSFYKPVLERDLRFDKAESKESAKSGAALLRLNAALLPLVFIGLRCVFLS
jgi:hypothetical protein